MFVDRIETVQSTEATACDAGALSAAEVEHASRGAPGVINFNCSSEPVLIAAGKTTLAGVLESPPESVGHGRVPPEQRRPPGSGLATTTLPTN